MSIELKPSSLGSDVRCAVCGQGFLLFSSRLAHLHRHEVATHVQHFLRQHHAACDDHHAHPSDAFCMPLLPDVLCPADR